MASWMMHFRVADALLNAGILEGFSPEAVTAFVLGNVAPDSGSPTPDGGYSPNKNTSHFMKRFEGVPTGQNPERCDPEGFAQTWLVPSLADHDPVAFAFYTGYLCHLVTDNAWVRDFIYPAKVQFAHLRLTDGRETPEGVARFYAFLKQTWYNTDFLYIRRYPNLPAYHSFLAATDVENRFLPFFPADAFETKRTEIREFYKKHPSEEVALKTYISDEEAEAFIKRVREEIRDRFEDLLWSFQSKLTYY